MAVFHPIEFFGVAADRDIVICHDVGKRRRDSTGAVSVISFDSVFVDEESVTCRPWFSSTAPLTSALGLPSPSSSFANLAPEEFFVQSSGVSRLVDGKSGPPTADDVPREIHDLSPLDRFAKAPQRHEQIAISLTSIAPPCSLPYFDYLPCPGSGPGSPAVSVATDYIPPAAIPVIVEPPMMPPRLDTMMFQDTPPPPPAISPRDEIPDISRTQEWLAVVLEQAPDQLDPATRQETPLSSMTLEGGLTDDDDIIEIDEEEACDISCKRCADDSEEDRRADEYDGGENSSARQGREIMSYEQLRSTRNERVAQKGLRRQHRAPRMRQVESPPRKRAKNS